MIHLVQKAPPTSHTGIVDIRLPCYSQSNHTDGASASSTPSANTSADVTTATSSQFIVGTIPLRNPANINPASITQVTSAYCIVGYFNSHKLVLNSSLLIVY